MKTNEVYDVDGCKDFIPVIIDGIFDDGVAVTVSDEKRDYKLVVEEVYRFPKVHEPQKVVVPKLVAEWIESQKESFPVASAIDMYYNLTSDNIGGYYHKVWLWVIDHHYDFIKAWHDGYEVEQEPLYTVEIPNPNSAGGKLVLFKQQSSGRLILDILNPNINKPKYLHLTESEIKQDFEWAWQWAKEVK